MEIGITQSLHIIVIMERLYCDRPLAPIQHIDPGAGLQPGPMPFLLSQAGKKEFPGIHQVKTCIYPGRGKSG